MRRLSLGQSIWFFAVFAWIILFAIASQEGLKLSLVIALCVANLLMIAADFLHFGKVYVKTGFLTLISLFPVVWRIRNPERFPPGFFSLLYMFLYLFVLIAVGSVMAVFFTKWTEEREKLDLSDVYYDEKLGWKPKPPDDLPPPSPFKFSSGRQVKRSSKEPKEL